MGKKHLKRLSTKWAFYWEWSWKYTNLTPSIALVHNGQVIPTGISVKFLWLSMVLVYIPDAI